MRIDMFPQINLSGMTPQQALVRIAEHVNELTGLVVKLNNELEDMKHRHDERAREMSVLQARFLR